MGPKHQQIPIWRDATRMLVEIEQAVRHFPRYHKYALGSELRLQAMAVCRAIVRAADAGRPGETADAPGRNLYRLTLAVEDIKLSIQLAKEVNAFASFSEFSRVAELAVAVGKQSGGWRKRARARARPEVQSDAVMAGG